MTYWGDRHDPAADAHELQERHDRALEQGSHPSIFLGPLSACAECGVVPKEIVPGHWACVCSLPVGTATTSEEKSSV